MKGGLPRVVWHTTESYNPWSGRRYYHVVIGQDNQDAPAIARQYRSINRAAYGLRNLNGGVQTNRQGDHCVQIAFAWRSANIKNMPDAYYVTAQAVLDEVEALTGVGHYSRFPVGLPSSLGYGYNAESRMSAYVWANTFDGHCAHQEVPENTHWDCGLLPWNKLLGDALEIPEIPEDEEMVIQKGDKGYGVKIYQQGLKAWNPQALPRYGADGDFGNETYDWVVNFQTAHDLDETGKISGADGALILSY
jgi:hypothetical protein